MTSKAQLPMETMPTEKDMMHWQALSQQGNSDSPKKITLRGAICDYVDEMEIDQLMEDLLSILTKEETYFRERANIYAGLKDLVGQMAENFKGNQNG